MFKLVISDDEGKTTVVPLVRDEVTIGRKEGNTIRLTERNVSRRHARLLKSNGAFTVEDLRSYNGVRINGQRIEGAAEVRAGDQISIGDYMLALQLESSAGVEPAAPGPGAIAASPTALIAAPTAQLPPRLVMLTPPAPGAEFALSKGAIRIGRAEDLDAWVNHRSISREHAEVVREGDGFRIVDLGSANGVRVNGKDVTTAPLTSGDVIELGQVRFRFVAAGEAYAFEVDQTVQMDALGGPGGFPKTSHLVALAAFLGLSLLVAVFLAMGGEEGDEPLVVPETGGPGAATEPATEPATAPTPAPSPESNYAQDLEACQRSIEANQYDEAVARAQAALAARPDDAAAETCLAAARRARGHQVTFDRAMAEYERGDVEAAFETLGELPTDSAFHNREEARVVHDAVVREYLERGRAALESDPTEAKQWAGFVRAMPRLTAEQRQAAADMEAEAERLGGAVAVAPTPHRNRRRSTMRRRHATADVASPAASMGSTMMAAAMMGGGGDPLLQCMTDSNYSRCIVRRLPSPRSRRQVAAVIEAHRRLGNQPQMLRVMESYVRRFDDGRSRGFRQILVRHGRSVP